MTLQPLASIRNQILFLKNCH